MSKAHGNFALVVSGGPAPGINSVVAAAAIEAVNRGYGVKGIVEGFRGLASGDDRAILDLTIDSVNQHATRGGSFLGTSRFNPFKNEEDTARLVSAIERHSIDKLITIGGEGSAFLSRKASTLVPGLRVAHVPKTIDNDLILPNDYPSFGFETARYVGTRLLRVIATDAQTTRRWFIVTSMGRKSGALALGIGLSAGTTLTLIPEELGAGRVAMADVVETIIGSMKRRATEGKTYGVAVIAEGVIDKIDPDSVPALAGCPRDDLGRIRYDELKLEDMIAAAVRARLEELELPIKISTKNIGFELRCEDPIAFDLEYTRMLGFGAVEFLDRGRTGAMIVRNYDKLDEIPFDSMVDASGNVRSRSVSLDSDLYRIARAYMVR